MKRLVTLLVFVLFISCSKEFVLQESSSLDNFTCPSTENCLSSQEEEKSSNYIMPFKMIAASGTENIDMIEKVLIKIGDFQIDKDGDYLKAQSDEVQLEFIANEAKKNIAVRSQIIKQGFFSYDQGRSDIEKVRFNLFQGNF